MNMHPAILELFEYTRAEVTAADIKRFSFGDPGYEDYVRTWTGILKSGIMPTESSFDLSESIAMAGHDTHTSLEFLRYRRFTSAVAMGLLYAGEDSDSVIPLNYLACDLVRDAANQSHHYISLLRRVVVVLRERAIELEFEDDYPYWTLASMILAQRQRDWPASEAAATQALGDVARVISSKIGGEVTPGDFFVDDIDDADLRFDQRDKQWRQIAATLINPTNHDDTQLVIDQLRRLGMKNS
jgi:hypothetical protein